MPGKVKVRFEGGREMADALREFESITPRKNIARRALRGAAEPIRQAWQAGTKVLTGRLIRSVVVGTRLTRRQARAARARKADVELYVGTADPAGIQEEFGNVHQAAHPAARPAWDSQGGEVTIRRIDDSLNLEIDKAAKRAARKALKAKR